MVEQNIPQKRCGEPNCKYLEDGTCLEGNEGNCHNLSNVFGPVPAFEESNLDSSISSINATTFDLPQGFDLADDEICRITYCYPTNLIVLVGEPESGKSTLYASLFDRFHKGPVGDFFYNDCETPISFESRAHDARLESNNADSVTDRTKAYEFGYLHLAVRHRSNQDSAKHLLFADVNGERFQHARDKDESMKSLDIFKRATHILFVVDGELLTKGDTKHAVKTNLISLIERGRKNNMFTERRYFNLLITKWDKVLGRGKERSVDEFLVDPILKRYTFLERNVIKVASRSTNEDCQPGFGMVDFLLHCISNPLKTLEGKQQYSPNRINYTRQFLKFESRL